ncbi:DUF3459 domain-containing protein, partial [Vibrio parahaemolyticus]
RPELTDPSRHGLSARTTEAVGGRVYERRRGDLVVLVNLSVAAASVPVASGSGVLLATIDGVTLDGDALEVPAGGAAIAGLAL